MRKLQRLLLLVVVVVAGVGHDSRVAPWPVTRWLASGAAAIASAYDEDDDVEQVGVVTSDSLYM